MKNKIIILNLALVLIISLAGSLATAAPTVERTASTETTCQGGKCNLII